MPEVSLKLSSILGKNGLSVLSALGRGRLSRDFYLAGGTGLALQIKHRISKDLDFFKKKPADRIKLNTIAGELDKLFGLTGTKPVMKQVDQAIWDIKGVKTTFIAFPFPVTYPLVRGETVDLSLKGIMVASPREIALMKAYSIGRRATTRDYFDLYFLLEKGITTIEEIIQQAFIKFTIDGEPLFSPKLFLEQLVYTEDLEDRDIPLVTAAGIKLTVKDMEEYFRSLVRVYLEKQNMAGSDAD
ncbi:MAG: nucleotidyl transferase AbiEii/AbiGii toxin family protein [Eubacteriales bacterium]